MTGNNVPDAWKRKALEEFFHWLVEKWLAAQNTNLPASKPASVQDQTASAYFLDRVNPDASPASLQELSAYEGTLGNEVCRYAIDVSLDAKKANWPYIRAILRNWSQQGVKCLADVRDLEAKRDAARSQRQEPRQSGNPFLEMLNEIGGDEP